MFRSEPKLLRMCLGVVLIMLGSGQLESCSARGLHHRCMAARRQLDLPSFDFRVHKDQGKAMSGSICTGQQPCCSTRDKAKLLQKAKTWVQEAIVRQVSEFHSVAESLSRDLKDSTCTLLAKNRMESHNFLSRVYGQHYERHRDLFDKFYCRVRAISQECNQCEQAVEAVSVEVLTNIQVHIIMEKEFLLALTPKFKQCAVKQVDLTSHKGISEPVRWLVTGLKRGICEPCVIRKALEQIPPLLTRLTNREPRSTCLEQVACMQSCSCCSGNSTACSQKPCRSCCRSAVTPCMDSLRNVQTTLQDISEKLTNRVTFMEGSNAPDHRLSQIGTGLMDFISSSMTLINTDPRVKRRIERTCGSFRENVLTVTAASSSRTYQLPQCMQCSRQKGSIDKALVDMCHQLQEAVPTAQHLEDNTCPDNLTADSVCNRCPSCTSRLTSPGEENQFLSTLSKGALEFQQQVPELYPPVAKGVTTPVQPTPPCDDEDCDNESGSSSGSGTEEPPSDQPKVSSPETNRIQPSTSTSNGIIAIQLAQESSTHGSAPQEVALPSAKPSTASSATILVSQMSKLEIIFLSTLLVVLIHL